MDINQKLAHLRLYADEHTDDETLLSLLEISGAKLLSIVYPYGYPEGTQVPSRYSLLQVEIAGYLDAKRGVEGQTSHSENGLNRNYEDADIPSSMLRGVVPFVGSIQ